VTPRARLVLTAVVVALLAVPAAAQEAKPADKQKLTDKLARKITLEKLEGTFKQAVELFATKFDLPLVVDPSVGAAAGGMAEACDAADDLQVRLPRLVNVRVDTALRILCEQVHAMYVVRPDHVRIVGAAQGLLESGVIKAPEPGDSDSPFAMTMSDLDVQKYKPLSKRALVTAGFKGVALSDVLDEVAESTGATVVLSPDVGPMADRKVTARFANTPVDAVVRTLCEIADLGVIEDANVLVVTTKEKAAARAKVEDDKRKARSAAALGLAGGLCGTPFAFGLGGPGGGLVGGGGIGLTGVAAPADLSAEVAKLKEQNEQLKKQVEELQKSIKK
jgi:hypothetical protein